jgi:O-methyltransferase involved in polyketide biosynthesis
MNLTRAKANVARTAHLTAYARALGRLTAGEVANGDYLADRALLPYQAALIRVPRLSRWLLEQGVPGALGYFNARTRYFDDVLLQEARTGLEQLVILGAGFDSRSIRFSDALRGARVFEVDMPQVLALRAERLLPVQQTPAHQTPAHQSPGHQTHSHETTHPAIAVPIDFESEDLGQALRRHGYASGVRTLFLWEGVTYYLPLEAVRAVLSFVASQSGPGSSVLFDYVTKAFVDGDHSSYGARRLADGWRRLGNVNRCGLNDADADMVAFVSPLGLQVRTNIDAAELERRYLSQWLGPRVRAWGCMRVAHVIRP